MKLEKEPLKTTQEDERYCQCSGSRRPCWRILAGTWRLAPCGCPNRWIWGMPSLFQFGDVDKERLTSRCSCLKHLSLWIPQARNIWQCYYFRHFGSTARALLRSAPDDEQWRSNSAKRQSARDNIVWYSGLKGIDNI